MKKKFQWVNSFDLSNNSKLLAFGRFDMEEEEHRKQCKATNRQVEVEAPSPCPNRVSTRRLADTESTYTCSVKVPPMIGPSIDDNPKAIPNID
jgi:hypothetical protein